MKHLVVFGGLVLASLSVGRESAADDSAAPAPAIRVADGFTIEQAAGPPLVERPITAAFDDEGRLYVAESSGSNDPVAKQLEERPHRVVRLEDADGDGRFDRRVVFADRMMFPEGTMFLDGSLYVSAPPSIWKLTDTDGDGVADERVEWFQGKTLTGCANDLHGPYAGPDGWIYWCKGAFAEQMHVVNGRPWTTRAAHIFRCRPDGSGFEPVLTGGMDNPVDVAFMPDGERVLSATYLVGEGRRDGLVHAIYGGVYGKQHGVLDGHARTGELMPALALMSPVAPCGLERYDGTSFGAEFADNLFACQFNLRTVSRHVLKPAGSSWASEDSPFVTWDNVDFHPTDVLVDADGSLLVVDTGGWYKLCCPTSQLWKPDVLGGVYRVRRAGAKPVEDPRGLRMAWEGASAAELWARLGDARPAVRARAARDFARARDTGDMHNFLGRIAAAAGDDAIVMTSAADGCDGRTAALARTWALVPLETDVSKALVRRLLIHADEQVRHAAMHAASLHRDGQASAAIVDLLGRDTAANRRIAAEALGRIGDRSAVPHLLAAAAKADDRILQHSITYALIELADPGATRAGVTAAAPGTVAAALVALDQMPGGDIEGREVIPLLNSPDPGLQASARWLASRRPEWGGEIASWLREQLASYSAPEDGEAGSAAATSLESMLVSFAGRAEGQQVLAEAVGQRDWPLAARQLGLRVMASARGRKPPPAWTAALAATIAGGDPQLLELAIAAARALPDGAARNPKLAAALTAVAGDAQKSLDLRVAALAAATRSGGELTDEQLAVLAKALASDNPVAVRSAAADAISVAALSHAQLDSLCELLVTASPLEINRLLAPLERGADDALGAKLLASLKQAEALASLRMDLVRNSLTRCSPAVQAGVSELETLVNVDAADQRRRIEELLPEMAQGDVRRGHAVFVSAKASCVACHRMGHAGGNVGPELTHIGAARTDRDLLESILYPSLSFVRSYESVLVFTADGKTINGRVHDETEDELVLDVGPDQQARVRRSDVEEMRPSATSVMPAGLDKQLSVQELADLVAFLRNTK